MLLRLQQTLPFILRKTVFQSIEFKRGILILFIISSIIPAFANNYILEILSNAWLYVILCLGLNIAVGYAGLLDLGYAAFFAIGAYTTGILSTHYFVDFWVTIPCAVLLSVCAGFLIGAPTLRLRSDYLAIVTLGFGEIIRLVSRNLSITGGASGIIGINRPVIFGVPLYKIWHFYYLFLILSIAAIIICYRLQGSRLGRAWQYLREDEDAAEAMGIDKVQLKLYAYIIHAVFGGVAGSFYAAKMTAISPESFSFTQSVLILLGVILGGMGKIPGVIAGAFVLVVFPEIFRFVGSMRLFVFAVLMLLIVLYRPNGIWPNKPKTPYST